MENIFYHELAVTVQVHGANVVEDAFVAVFSELKVQRSNFNIPFLAHLCCPSSHWLIIFLDRFLKNSALTFSFLRSLLVCIPQSANVWASLSFPPLLVSWAKEACWEWIPVDENIEDFRLSCIQDETSPSSPQVSRSFAVDWAWIDTMDQLSCFQWLALRDARTYNNSLFFIRVVISQCPVSLSYPFPLSYAPLNNLSHSSSRKWGRQNVQKNEKCRTEPRWPEHPASPSSHPPGIDDASPHRTRRSTRCSSWRSAARSLRLLDILKLLRTSWLYIFWHFHPRGNSLAWPTRLAETETRTRHRPHANSSVVRA